MSDLSFREKSRLETYFQLGRGHVLGFSNARFAEFVFASTGRDIYNDKYRFGTNSKVNRLRAFWSRERNPIAGKLINDLLEHYGPPAGDALRERLYEECRLIATRLMESDPDNARKRKRADD